MSLSIIRFENVSKRYRLGAGRENLREVLSRLPRHLRRLLGGHPSVKASGQADERQLVWALRDVSFEIQAGETVGIIGANGAGKTTLLKLLSRVTQPTAGSIHISGRVSSLIELGAGFHPDLSGRENIYLNGVILGLSRREVTARFDQIVAFSELERFLDTPVKRYSSGMYARLGFSVAAFVEPDILLVDEVLSVGDVNFQKKCLQRMRQLASEGRAVLYVSHNLPSVRGLCRRAIWLDGGRVCDEGPPAEVISKYADEMNRRALTDAGRGLYSAVRRGAGQVRFTRVETLDGQGQERSCFSTADVLRVRAAYEVREPVAPPRFDLLINDLETGAVVTSAGQQVEEFPPAAPGQGSVQWTFDPLLLRPGRYALYLAISDRARLVSIDVWDGAGSDIVISPATAEGSDGYTAGIDVGLVSVPVRFEHQVGIEEGTTR